MKHFYIRYPRNFGNEYSLAWVESGSAAEKTMQEDGWERINRKTAIRKCAEERYRRRTDRAFSGYADSVIFPIDYDPEREYVTVYDLDSPRCKWYTNDGYIIERKAARQ